MSEDIDEEFQRRVSERAYHLWQAAGAPEDRSDEFWHTAHRFEESLRHGGTIGAADEQDPDKTAPETSAETLTKARVPDHRGVI
jgi:hypothetical protein